MNDAGLQLTSLLEKYFNEFETNIVQPALAELAALERGVIDNFKQDVKNNGSMAKPEQLARDLKKIAWVQSRIEERHRKIQRVVANGM